VVKDGLRSSLVAMLLLVACSDGVAPSPSVDLANLALPSDFHCASDWVDFSENVPASVVEEFAGRSFQTPEELISYLEVRYARIGESVADEVTGHLSERQEKTEVLIRVTLSLINN
jgi:hypothetical protein